MALTLAGVSSALVGFTTDAGDQQGQLISRRTIDVITCCYTPLAILIMLYALFTYEYRSKFLRKKQVGVRRRGGGPFGRMGARAREPSWAWAAWMGTARKRAAHPGCQLRK
jgi:hypothetical protein